MKLSPRNKVEVAVKADADLRSDEQPNASATGEISEEHLAALIMAREPFDAKTALRLSVSSPVILAWDDEGSYFCAGKVVGGDKKTKLQVIGWPSEGGAIGLMLMPDAATGRVLVDQRRGREYKVYPPNTSERDSISRAERRASSQAATDANAPEHAGERKKRSSAGSYSFDFKKDWRLIKGMTKQGVALLALVEQAGLESAGESELSSILEAGRDTVGVGKDRNLASLFKSHYGWTYEKFGLVKRDA